MRNNRRGIFLALALALAVTQTGRAYVLEDPIVNWQPGTITVQIKLGATPVLTDGTNYTSSVQAAMLTWNAQLGTVQFLGQAATASDVRSDNNINEIVFNTSVDGEAFGEGVLAVTLGATSPSVHELVETDIVFNRAYTWNSYRGAAKQTPIDIRRVILHELGHVLGLDHADKNGGVVSAIMNSRVSSTDTLTADDISGVQVLYGLPGVTTIPANDVFANATVVTLVNNTAQFTSSNIFATKQAGEPAHAGSTGGHSVWWKWTAPASGSMVITTEGSRFDTVLAVYTGGSVSALGTALVSNDDVVRGSIRYSSVTFNATAGTTYYMVVDGWADYRGYVQLNLNQTPTGVPPPPPPPPTGTTGRRVINISARGACGTGDRVMIGGFVVSGSAGKRVLVRAVGPTLTTQGIGQAEVLLDPVIEVHQGTPVIASNDNWVENSNAAEITATATQVGASAFAASDTKSSALLLTLQPGVYSFVATGKGASSGIVLLEVYDADSGASSSSFSNIATRAYSTTGNGVTIGGFVISGSTGKQVLLRAIGPTLTKQGIAQSDVLADPVIELHDASHGNVTIATNDNWGTNTNAALITTTGARLGATPLDASDTKSAALLMTLQPGAYSFVASGLANSSGIVLVEVYDAD
ncbi:MAG: matrixin family metalloprotease [Opitutus sp.]